MEVPGLHSIFTQLRLIFEYRDQDSSRLSYRVEEADNRFQLVTLAVGGCGLAGSVTAVVRTPPVTQAGMSEVNNHGSRGRVSRDHSAGDWGLSRVG